MEVEVNCPKCGNPLESFYNIELWSDGSCVTVNADCCGHTLRVYYTPDEVEVEE